MVNLSNVVKLTRFFSKKATEVAPIKTVAVVFNIANAMSILAATLYTLVRQQHDDPDVQVTMVDIRDNIPAADLYLWVDAGKPDGLREALKDRIGKISNPSEEKSRLAEIEKHSIILETEQTDTPSIATTAFGKVLMDLEASFPTLENDLLPRRVAARLWGLSLGFEEPHVTVDDYSAYLRALSLVYAGYHGTRISLHELNEAIAERGEPTDIQLSAFREEQQFFASLISRKTRLDLIGNKYVYFITELGPDIYALIRRIRLAKKPFIHTAIGCYGIVVYTDTVLDVAALSWKEKITLAPEFHPKATQSAG